MTRSSQRATSCSRMAAQGPPLVACAPTACDDTPQLHVDIDQAKASALGLSVADINDTLGAAWGSLLHQRVRRPWPRQARLYARRRAVPHDAGRPGPLVRAHGHRHDGAVLVLRALQWARAVAARALQRRARARNPGHAGAGQEHRRGHGRDGRAGRPSCPRASATSGPGFPIRKRSRARRRRRSTRSRFSWCSCCLAALYESWAVPFAVMLVIPLGVIGAIAGRHLARPLQRRLFPGGPARHHRPLGKNAILIVEFAEDAMKRGSRFPRGGARRRATAPAADPDDVARLHRRRAPRWRSRRGPAPPARTTSAPA